jgi:thiamine monophosphate kinase
VNESEIVAELAAIFARPGVASAGVILGIGDDAALIAPTRAPLAVTTDTAI